MEVADALNGCRLKVASGGVAERRWSDDRGHPNGDVHRQETDASPGSPSSKSVVFCENHSALPNDNDADNWTHLRPESVWLECLYSWNPLAAGSHYV